MDPKELLYQFRLKIMIARMNGDDKIDLPVNWAIEIEPYLRKEIES